jgi:hypothetical protein
MKASLRDSSSNGRLREVASMNSGRSEARTPTSSTNGTGMCSETLSSSTPAKPALRSDSVAMSGGTGS